MYRVVMVCLGNICRSPIAQAVLQDRVDRAGMEVTVSSAGTGNWHVGEDADRRARAALRRAGYSLHHAARQFRAELFDSEDVVVAMDRQNRDDLLALRPDAEVMLLRQWDPQGKGDVPDPYSGDDADFDRVVAMAERCCDGLLAWLLETRGVR